MYMNASIYGLVAEFEEPEQVLNAAIEVRKAGYRLVETYTPFPVHGMTEALDCEDPKIPWTIFLAGVAGAVAGFSLEVVTMTPLLPNLLSNLPRWVRNLPTMNEMAYPLNVGGRPFLSWPSFIPPAFEMTILFASFGAVIGMLAFNKLPQPHHPIFNAPNFDQASQDRFFLCIEATDPRFEYENTWQFLQSLGPAAVAEVDR
jgi:hypothetical protein